MLSLEVQSKFKGRISPSNIVMTAEMGENSPKFLIIYVLHRMIPPFVVY